MWQHTLGAVGVLLLPDLMRLHFLSSLRVQLRFGGPPQPVSRGPGDKNLPNLLEPPSHTPHPQPSNPETLSPKTQALSDRKPQNRNVERFVPGTGPTPGPEQQSA